eukprot:TRINITY_DN5371_c0_g1_i1.p1 TRINITY_DN5371_c0_g1~~TRINITY_DN5371_c0_g1_i1.p1  ORF type:complete len:458 (-),score=97.15 TRINITY_DN5371_c0_g1_i1:145-1473(-)
MATHRRANQLAQVTYMETDSDVNQPHLVYFPQTQPQDQKLSSDADDGIKFTIQQESSRKRSISAVSASIEWKGTNYGADSQSRNLVKYALGVFSKSTGSIQIVEVPHIYRLQQRIKRVKENDSFGADAISGREQNNALTAAFGTQKRQRELKAREINEAATKQAIISSDVHQTLASQAASLPTAEDRLQEPEDHSYIPPYDLTATEPHQIYNVHDIILRTDRRALADGDLLKACTDPAHLSELRQKKKYPTHVLDAVARLVTKSVDESMRQRQCRALEYLTFMIEFTKLPRVISRNPGDVATELGIPPIIFDSLLQRFAAREQSATGDVAYVRNAVLIDKLVAYIIVLALQLNGFALRQGPLAADLRLTATKFKAYCRAIGCKAVTPRSGKMTAQRQALYDDCVYGTVNPPADGSERDRKETVFFLEAPLVFPKPPKGRAKK